MTFSSLTSRTSAVVLFVGGATMLFAADVVLPRLVPGFPLAAAWFGQLLGAAWLGVAALNWLNRSAVLGGIYGRPIVLANLALYFIGAMVLLKARGTSAWPLGMLVVAVPFVVLAGVYGFLLLRGPIERDMPSR